MNLAFLGSGHVGAALAVRLADAGHTVVLAESRPGGASVAAALARSKKLTARMAVDAVAAADVVFLTTPFGANEDVLKPLVNALSGKVLVDCTNPVGPGLTHGLRSERSGSEFVQSLVPSAHVVKAFSIYGYENLERPGVSGDGGRPAMLFCGDDAAAKAKVARLVADCGFDPLDVGGVVQALHLEHMTLLWIRMVRAGGHDPSLVWTARTRPASNP